MDRLAPARSARLPAARQRPRPDAENVDGEVSWRLCVLAAWQPHREHRAFARLARHGHIAAHHACELAGDGEPKPGAAEALRGRGIGLAELLEQLCLLLCGHADAGVGDRELDEAPAMAHLACRKLDFARFGELAGVAEEVEQDLP